MVGSEDAVPRVSADKASNKATSRDMHRAAVARGADNTGKPAVAIALRGVSGGGNESQGPRPNGGGEELRRGQGVHVTAATCTLEPS